MSTTFEQSEEIAQVMSSEARRMYERNGRIDTALSVIGRHAIVAIPPEGETIETIPRLARFLSWGARATHIAFIGEAWRQEVDDDGSEHPRPRDIVDTDPTVETCLIVVVQDVTDPDLGHTMESIVRLDEENGALGWVTEHHHGAPSGDLADRIRQELSNPPPWPPPHADALEMFGEDLVDRGLALAVWVSPA